MVHTPSLAHICKGSRKETFRNYIKRVLIVLVVVKKEILTVKLDRTTQNVG